MHKLMLSSLFFLMMSGALSAQDTYVKNISADVLKGDLEYGQYLSAECVTCHSASGADKGIPPITGWDTESFVAVVNAYKNKELENQAMQLIAGRLDDEQIASLALFFATFPEAK